jgi:Bacterial regulatory proteins, tetR family
MYTGYGRPTGCQRPKLTGRAPGRQRDPKTDLALVEAVLDLVSAGATLSGLSLVTIAKRAGVSRNSLYRRWKTKDALYLDVLGSINPPLPDFSGPSAFDNVADHLAILIVLRRISRPTRKHGSGYPDPSIVSDRSVPSGLEAPVAQPPGWPRSRGKDGAEGADNCRTPWHGRKSR